MENKNEIIERLLREGHLKLDEALVLLDYGRPQLTQLPYPYFPCFERIQPYYGDGFKITCATANQEK